MNESKIERQLNLFFILLNSNRPVTRHEIKNKILDYKNNDSEKAFERMFERDKDDLRKNGIRINTINLDSLFDDEIGYQLDKETFIAKEITLREDEKLILKYALSLWNDGEVYLNAENVFRKIGVPNTDFVELADLRHQNRAFEIHQKILKAIISHNQIKILYISAYQDEPQWRILQPLQVTTQANDLFLQAVEVNAKNSKSYKILNILEVEILNEKFLPVKLIDEDKVNIKKVQLRIKSNKDYYVKILNGVVISADLIEISVFNYVSTARFLLPYIHVIDEILDKELREAVLIELNNIYEAVNG
jgi:predicted DNA-binding transcriptional regulator YafY